MGMGDVLREEREKQGFTWEDVEEETKIRKYYIKALENEDFSSLPPQVYATGFVRRYAKFLGLDEQALVDEFKSQAYPEDIEESEGTMVHSIPETDRRFSTKNIAAGIIFLVVAIWAGNHLAGYLSHKGINNPADNPPRIEEPAGNKKDNVKPTPKEPRKINISKVKIEATQPCWVTVIVDGDEQLTGIMQVGETKTFEGKDLIYIKAGNAGGLVITYNGEKAPPLGDYGEVAEHEFPAQVMQSE
ncbi:helix-turn-helix domain-containing protein [Syntrophomonas erecta]